MFQFLNEGVSCNGGCDTIKFRREARNDRAVTYHTKRQQYFGGDTNIALLIGGFQNIHKCYGFKFILLRIVLWPAVISHQKIMIEFFHLLEYIIHNEIKNLF